MLVNGLLLATLGVAMLLPAIVDLMADNDDWQVFAAAPLLTILIGAGLYAGARGTVSHMSTRQAFVMVTLAWITPAAVWLPSLSVVRYCAQFHRCNV